MTVGRFVSIISGFLFLTSTLFPLGAKEFKLYYLGGQSNMDGYGYNKDLPAELQDTTSGVMIFHGNTGIDDKDVDGKGIWAELQPGHGVGFSSDGKTNTYSDRFGAELTFVQKMQSLLPGENIAIIKYSKGGTSIDEAGADRFGSWEPDYEGENGINQYDHFLATIKHALSVEDIDGDGEKDYLIPAGIVWMQGESDAHEKEIAMRYEANLKRLMDLIRAAFRTDDLPVVIGRIADSGQDEDGKVWDHGEIVRSAQAAFVEKDACAALVTSTDAYGFSDRWHYDSAGYLDLGVKFAKAMASLKDCR